MQRVSYIQLEGLISSATKPVFVIAFGDNCGRCKMMQPVIKRVMAKVGDAAIFAAINAQTNMEFSTKYSVRQLPTMFVFEGGEVKTTFQGFASEVQLLKALVK